MYLDKQQSQCNQQTAMAGGLIHAQQQGPSGPLESAMDSVAHGMQEAFAALDRLSEGLRLVLQPESPNECKVVGNQIESAPRSPAVNRLHGLRLELEVLTSRMNALRARSDA